MVLFGTLQEKISGIFGCISGENQEKKINNAIIGSSVMENGSCMILKITNGKKQSVQICGTGIKIMITNEILIKKYGEKVIRYNYG